MKKLFDETNEFESKYYRTIWYGYVVGSLDERLQEKVVATVQADLAQKTENPLAATHWVFYSEETSKDAIGDTVRPSLMIRERDGVFVANYNVSDFGFVTAFDMIADFTEKLEEQLNA
ncbi:hypothetical protein PWEIH_07741 [Listeria weihenstephanensis FSL R9-0317]|uniref:Uncharacterized protein n=1 Tax=Listeria weihenstephanensis TaxID=1006155 RepID=A0A1S7FVY9_9LIST|nr:hypothetical protein [Listeria weihenstephanensis]AQY51517.1 hypothetical protein UE46_11050 [Listeria weihenstephanensis]EUJ39295.1 hypothetical protein PWEIH_07741 [Listeria weihenstephanensis FSL R9-0317]MBC1501048.1 hypothetical protein [Listeria weihenstephanensis]